MGSVQKERLTYNEPFKYMKSDLIGRYKIREFVNARCSRNIWLMTSICHFRRYVTVTCVDSLSKESILNAFKLHFLKYSASKVVQTDFGTNFSIAKDDLEAKENVVNEEDLKKITETLKSQGCQLNQIVPKAPWIQGGVERAFF